MSYSSFRTLVRKVLYEVEHGPLPGDPDAPTSSLFVVRELENLGFAYEYLAVPAGNNTCFPTVVLYTEARSGLSVEHAIQLVRHSKPREIKQQSGVITARYAREPNDPENPEHYAFFLPGLKFPDENSFRR